MGQVLCRSIMFFEEGNLLPSKEADPKIMLIQPILNFMVPFLPTQLSFTLFAAVSGLLSEDEYNLEIKIIDPEGTFVNEIAWNIESSEINVNSGATEGSGMMVVSIKNMIIKEKGRYSVVMLSDNEQIGEQFFDILVIEEGVSNNGTH